MGFAPSPFQSPLTPEFHLLAIQKASADIKPVMHFKIIGGENLYTPTSKLLFKHLVFGDGKPNAFVGSLGDVVILFDI